MKEIKLTEELSYLLYNRYKYVLLSDGKHKEVGFNDITEIGSFLSESENDEDYMVCFVCYNNSDFDIFFKEIQYSKIEFGVNRRVICEVFRKEIKPIWFNK